MSDGIMGVILGVLWLVGSTSSAMGMADSITYQGRIHLSGQPINELCDLEFRVFDTVSYGNQVGAMVTVFAVDVVDKPYRMLRTHRSSRSSCQCGWSRLGKQRVGGEDQ